jgi:centrin-1
MYFLPYPELKLAMTNLGFEAKNQTIYQMICDLEADGVSAVNFQDFLLMMTVRTAEKDTRDNLRKVFNLFDDEKTGFVSVKNLRKITKELGEQIDEHELQEMIDKADLDNDGLVSEEEFYQIMTKRS